MTDYDIIRVELGLDLDHQDAFAALDRLEAENARLQTEVAKLRDLVGVSASKTIARLKAENARLREKLDDKTNVEQLVSKLEEQLRPRVDIDKFRGGYDCCGCSTYDLIVDDAVRVIRGESLPDLDGAGEGYGEA